MFEEFIEHGGDVARRRARHRADARFCDDHRVAGFVAEPAGPPERINRDVARLKQTAYDVGVINTRFVKPLDKNLILRAVEELPFIVTVEEGTLEGGFGSAVLEAANQAGLPTEHIRRCGVPDRWIMHAEREEQLSEVGLDVGSLVSAAVQMADRFGVEGSVESSRERSR